MPYTCCVPGCKTTGKKIFHSFPKDEKMCSKWIIKTKCSKVCKETAYKSHHKICRKHFREDEVKTSNRLRKGVFPTLELPLLNPHNYFKKNDVRSEDSGCIDTDLFMNKGAVSEEEYIMEDDETIIDDTGDSMEEEYIEYDGIDDDYVMENDVTIEDVEDADDIGQNYVLESVEIVDILEEDNDFDMENVVTIEDVEEDYDFGEDYVELVDIEADVIGNDSKTTKCEIPSTAKSSRTYDPIARKMRYQASRIKYLTRKLQECKATLDTVMKYLSSKLNPDQFSFIKLQLKNAGKQSRGRRFDFDDKSMALAVYKQSPKCYRFLSKMFVLPSRWTLNKHAARIRFDAGMNPKLLKFIKSTVSELKNVEKNVIVEWDEMALTAHLDFEEVKDYIDGFRDFDDKRTNSFANHALVFMVRGMKTDFKQPLAYFLTDSIHSDELSEIIKLIIEAVSETGLNVIGSVCDAVYTNVAAINKLIKPGCKHVSLAGNLLEYNVNGSMIIHIFDPPHLIKTVRNNLTVKDLKHNLMLDEKKYRTTGQTSWDKLSKKRRTASWKDVKAFYNVDCSSTFKLLPKITDEHINPIGRKMKVKLATQVFSGTFGRQMRFCAEQHQLSETCMDTSLTLLFFNDLFDSLNGGNTVENDTLTGSVHENSKHFTFWGHAISALNKMQFGPNLKTGKANRSNVFKHFLSTIKGVRKICENLFKLGFSSVSLRRANQDALENFFGCIRSYCYSSVTPTARQFRCAYSTSIINNMASKHSLNANCEDDHCKPLLRNLRILFTLTNDKDVSVNQNEINYANHFYNVLESHQLTFSSTHAYNHIAGRICKKLMTKIKCTFCQNTINAKEKCGGDRYVTRFVGPKQKNALLIYPTTEFIEAVSNILTKVGCMIPLFCIQKNLVQRIISELDFENNLGCDLHRVELKNEMKKIVTLLGIYTFTNKINNILSGKVTTASKDNDIIEKAAFEYRNKRKFIAKYICLNNDKLTNNHQ